MPLTEGQIFADYRIVRLLGSGGMGEVYLAEHPRLPRRNALKVLPVEISGDMDYRARFNREADLASKLWHPHIVSVHDRGEHNGQLWLAMDYVDGLDAARLLTSKFPAGMPVDRVVQIVTAVASALDNAHRRGLLHRDIKPANIMLTDATEDEQRILLTDFGIARDIDDISGLTATNMTVGTVAYSAPEQLMGDEVDGRADQYALAATAYHLLTGSHLFPHSNQAVVISRHLNSPPPSMASIRTDLGRLDDALAKALAKEPADRYPTCTAFARALAGDTIPHQATAPSAEHTHPSPVTLPSSSPAARRPPTRFLVASAVVMLILVAAGLVLWQPGSSRDDAASTAATSATAPTTAATTTLLTPISSPPPPPPLSTTTSSPPEPTTTLPRYPAAGVLGDWCSTPDAIGTGPGGVLYYCARVQYSDAHKWSLTPGVIPTTLAKPNIPPGSICMVPGSTVENSAGQTLSCDPAITGGWTWQFGGPN